MLAAEPEIHRPTLRFAAGPAEEPVADEPGARAGSRGAHRLPRHRPRLHAARPELPAEDEPATSEAPPDLETVERVSRCNFDELSRILADRVGGTAARRRPPSQSRRAPPMTAR